MRDSEDLKIIYETLLRAFGPQGWWPGDTQTEVIIGAVLTQNTAWTNVEKALLQLEKNNLLDFRILHEISEEELAELIRPSGYYTVKSKRLKNLVYWIMDSCNGNLAILEKYTTEHLRKELLSINGIGEETADSILLYAFNRSVFVVDTYTKRILSRHGFISTRATYAEIQDMYHRCYPDDVRVYNEYHALLVKTGKLHCKPGQDCTSCPLQGDL